MSSSITIAGLSSRQTTNRTTDHIEKRMEHEMDQKEAAEFVLHSLQKGMSCQQITLELSTMLNAPQSMVSRFVDSVAAAPQPLSSPQLHSTPSAAAQPVPPPGSKPLPGPGRFVSPTPTPLDAQQQAALEKTIIKELLRNKEQSDIVLEVCEITAMNWAEAQRLVARVASQNHKKLAVRQNMIVIPLAITALIAGLVLTFAAGSELLNLALATAGAQPMPRNLPPANTPIYLLLGISLSLGGAVGLIRALTSMSD
jgi:hypothetical protein